MKIFKISQYENRDYDTYDSAVVYAENEDEARNMSPSSGNLMTGKEWELECHYHYNRWAGSPESIKVEYLAEAKEGSKQGVILASFNAG